MKGFHFKNGIVPYDYVAPTKGVGRGGVVGRDISVMGIFFLSEWTTSQKGGKKKNFDRAICFESVTFR